MNKKEAKEFTVDANYGLNEMVNLINDQTEEIDYLKDEIVDKDNINEDMVNKITDLKDNIEDLNESDRYTVGIADSEYDFYER